MPSLQEQLLKAGLADEKKAKQINKEKRKKARQMPHGAGAGEEVKLATQQARAAKAEHDRELDRQQQARAEEKAIQAQIRQLIEVNRVARSGRGFDLPYQFVHGSKIKKIHVSQAQQDQLAKGQLALAELGGSYELVPATVAEKIGQRDAQRIVLKNATDRQAIEEDDPYADYQIPDDLMW